MKKNIVLIGEAFLELEPFEHERHASGSRFDLNLELRIWNWSWPAYRSMYLATHSAKFRNSHFKQHSYTGASKMRCLKFLPAWRQLYGHFACKRIKSSNRYYYSLHEVRLGLAIFFRIAWIGICFGRANYWKILWVYINIEQAESMLTTPGIEPTCLWNSHSAYPVAQMEGIVLAFQRSMVNSIPAVVS